MIDSLTLVCPFAFGGEGVFICVFFFVDLHSEEFACSCSDRNAICI